LRSNRWVGWVEKNGAGLGGARLGKAHVSACAGLGGVRTATAARDHARKSQRYPPPPSWEEMGNGQSMKT
jgi:hypothetical protein